MIDAIIRKLQRDGASKELQKQVRQSLETTKVSAEAKSAFENTADSSILINETFSVLNNVLKNNYLPTLKNTSAATELLKKRQSELVAAQNKTIAAFRNVQDVRAQAARSARGRAETLADIRGQGFSAAQSARFRRRELASFGVEDTSRAGLQRRLTALARGPQTEDTQRQINAIKQFAEGVLSDIAREEKPATNVLEFLQRSQRDLLAGPNGEFFARQFGSFRDPELDSRSASAAQFAQLADQADRASVAQAAQELARAAQVQNELQGNISKMNENFLNFNKNYATNNQELREITERLENTSVSFSSNGITVDFANGGLASAVSAAVKKAVEDALGREGVQFGQNGEMIPRLGR